MGNPYKIVEHLEKAHLLFGLEELSLDQLRRTHEWDHRTEYQDHSIHSENEAGYADGTYSSD